VKFADVDREDFPHLIALNESCIPHVNSIAESDLDDFLIQATCFCKLVDEEKNLGGFVIALQPGKPYDSVNYRWFERAYESFLYIDRIMISPASRRQGLASQIYLELIALANARSIPRLCCEVNLKPANPESQQLHHSLGFLSVGTQYTENRTKQVDLLVKNLTSEAS